MVLSFAGVVVEAAKWIHCKGLETLQESVSGVNAVEPNSHPKGLNEGKGCCEDMRYLVLSA